MEQNNLEKKIREIVTDIVWNTSDLGNRDVIYKSGRVTETVNELLALYQPQEDRPKYEPWCPRCGFLKKNHGKSESGNRVCSENPDYVKFHEAVGHFCGLDKPLPEEKKEVACDCECHFDRYECYSCKIGYHVLLPKVEEVKECQHKNCRRDQGGDVECEDCGKYWIEPGYTKPSSGNLREPSPQPAKIEKLESLDEPVTTYSEIARIFNKLNQVIEVVNKLSTQRRNKE